LKKKKTHLKTT